VSNKGLDISINEFLEHFEERHVEHSTSLHAVLKERGPYFVGPLARYALNFDRLTPAAKQAARDAGLGKVCNNPFKGIIVRSVETLYACEEALRIIKDYEMPDKPSVEIEPRAATGHGCSEAPRGVLYHRYEIDDKGVIRTARIIPPTSQNQTTIENDLKRFVGMNLDLADDKLKWHCEQAVRNYDPCISCSCHFLNVDLDRS